MRKRMSLVWIIVILLALAVFILPVSSTIPSGAEVDSIISSRASDDPSQNISAQAGNVTELNIFGYSITQTWQGYFGNVSGVIHLSDGQDRVLYNWTAVSPQGEVYASTNNSIVWTNIQCFNFTADASYGDESGLGGTTNLHGTNLSFIENQYNIPQSAVDGVDETFTFSGISGHNLFYSASNLFPQGRCRNTRIFDSTGGQQNNNFQEVLLYEPSSRSVIYSALLQNDQAGFDQRTHDFEMLVLEDGHGSDVSTTPYYFYVELE